jgi:hypothetical protein
MSKGSQPLAWRKRRGLLIIRTYAVTIAGTTDSVRIPPAPLDKVGLGRMQRLGE